MFHYIWDWVVLSVAIVAIGTLSIIDLKTYRLPNVVVGWSLVASVAAMGAASIATGDTRSLLVAAVAAVGYSVMLAVVFAVNPKGIGFGDVKFAALLGLHIGWAQASEPWTAIPIAIVSALLLACVLGTAMGITLAWHRRARTLKALLDTNFPFGPALGATTLFLIIM